jgi:hypothetical protein
MMSAVDEATSIYLDISQLEHPANRTQRHRSNGFNGLSEGYEAQALWSSTFRSRALRTKNRFRGENHALSIQSDPHDCAPR